MRFSPAAIALSLAFATVSSVSLGQNADADIKARSIEFMALGEQAQNNGELELARDFYETALAVDPRNGSAFIALAQIARAQGLPGSAIRLYREALILDPNNLAALAGQGETLVQRGAIEKAKVNLSRIRSLCGGSCDQTAQLQSAIDKSEQAPMLSAQAVTPKPVVEEEGAGEEATP